MKHLFTALALLLSVSPTLAASIDTGNLTPTLTYPKPAPAPAPVTKGNAGITP